MHLDSTRSGNPHIFSRTRYIGKAKGKDFLTIHFKPKLSLRQRCKVMSSIYINPSVALALVLKKAVRNSGYLFCLKAQSQAVEKLAHSIPAI